MSTDAQASLRRSRSTGDLHPPQSRQNSHVRSPQHSRHSTTITHQHGRAPALNLGEGASLVSSPPLAHREPRSARTSTVGVGGIFSPPAAVVQGMDDAQAHHQHLTIVYRQSWFSRTLAFFGYGRNASHSRRIFVSLLWNQGLGFTQIVIIITMLSIAGSKESPTVPGRTEWKACSRPLGAWCCLWIGRVILACFLTYWGWVRDRTAQRTQMDHEGNPIPQSNSSSSSNRPQASSNATTNGRGGSRSQSNNAGRHVVETGPPRSMPYTRLSLLSSLLTLSWFLTAHILAYTSVDTCRHSSPHLWWLIFGILCIMYLMVLEVVLLGFIVFVVAPILFVFWNILLVCIGRHPLQNPAMIKPEIGKLPKSVVDRIPLVTYIPPPPEDFAINSPITIPDPVYSYPPNSPSATAKPKTRPKRRFRFLRKLGKKSESGGDGKATADGKEPTRTVDEPQTWEDQWELGDYPFVRLEGNRAACAICLMDFDEPKRLFEHPAIKKPTAAVDDAGAPGATPVIGSAAADEDEKHGKEPTIDVVALPAVSQGDVEEVRVEPPVAVDDPELKLADAGEGAQPLRLLGCGHVFHKTCVDPWLTDVSGRCPVCQRPVELPEPPKGKRGNRRQP
ncbi:hypothetical protein HGRIS_002101 [Hohenbuehelia grisea]|uniref:RING-type domain-containing protein n=1 Tax=Hohenbuehelia grisea TaxID=104357 RepID=A0ABR3JJG5_9AGAR